jgi:hypothetical protein
MNRREMLGALAGVGAAFATLSPEDLWARGQEINQKLQSDSLNGLGPFTPHQAATVARMADLIIPPTDTPGAVDAKVPAFIAVIVGEWYPSEDRDLFMAGLTEVDATSQRRLNRNFVDLPENQQVALLSEMDAELQALRQRKEPIDKNFLQRMKGLTLYGYYTSEIGMTRELKYQIIPGRYDPCAGV